MTTNDTRGDADVVLDEIPPSASPDPHDAEEQE
jgi:hypothetical protein